MSPGSRARADQAAQRINAAAGLLARGIEVPAAARQLARRHRLSERQARRYLERARADGPVEVPRAKVAFTVKLAADVVGRVRTQARRSGRTVSALVTQAIVEYLDRLHGGAP
jgi:hypothetical protein